MIELDVFLTKIMPYVPGCPEPTAFAGILKAAQEFCERTRLWRDEDSFTLTPTSCNVVCAPEGADLFEIEHASLDGNPLEPISLADLNRRYPRWRELDSGQGQWITQIEPGSVVVVPTCTGALKLSTFLRPSEEAEQLPDFLARDYRQCIADGALAEILMLPGQSFTDPSRAQFYSLRFEAKLSELTNRSIKGQQRAPTRVRAQFM
jgi:hypothetical protein